MFYNVCCKVVFIVIEILFLTLLLRFHPWKFLGTLRSQLPTWHTLYSDCWVIRWQLRLSFVISRVKMIFVFLLCLFYKKMVTVWKLTLRIWAIVWGVRAAQHWLTVWFRVGGVTWVTWRISAALWNVNPSLESELLRLRVLLASCLLLRLRAVQALLVGGTANIPLSNLWDQFSWRCYPQPWLVLFPFNLWSILLKGV